jgi:hypothetical protein
VTSDPYGLGRVVGEPGVLPQRAARLDPSVPIRASELLIEVGEPQRRRGVLQADP